MDTYNLDDILANMESTTDYTREPEFARKTRRVKDTVDSKRWYLDETEYDASELEF